MEQKRQGEIALVLFKTYIRETGIPSIKDVKSGILKAAKASGISVEELAQFAHQILTDILKQAK